MNSVEEHSCTPNEIACTLLPLAREFANQIVNIESLSQTRVVIGVPIGPLQVKMLFTEALVQSALYCAGYEYAARRNKNVDRIVLREVFRAVGIEGDRLFNGGFLQGWNRLVDDVNGHEAIRRLTYNLQGDPTHIKELFIKSCIDWALRQSAGTGYLPSFAKDETAEYASISRLVNRFIGTILPKVHFESCNVVGGFAAIDLASLPQSIEHYDAFISYRRSDGDIIARLVYQELTYRGLKCFLDVDSVANGEYSLQILSALRDASNFVFIKTVDSLKGLDDPYDHVRIELEAARYFRRNVIIIVPPKVSRDMSNTVLPSELEYLRNLRSFRIDVGETYDFCVAQIQNVLHR